MSIHSQTETPGAFRQVVRVNAHTLHADIAAAQGGQDSAPGPHDYFDVSLATCKALTAAFYAKKHDIPLERVEAHVERDASHEREGRYGLTVRLAFIGPLSDADKERIYAAVGRCPIHKLMTAAKIEITTAPLEPTPGSAA